MAVARAIGGYGAARLVERVVRDEVLGKSQLLPSIERGRGGRGRRESREPMRRMPVSAPMPATTRARKFARPLGG